MNLRQHFDESSFDVVLSGFGVIFFPNPTQGLKEMYHVVKPGGKVLFSAWGLPEETPAFTIVRQCAVRLFGDRLPVVAPHRMDATPQSLTVMMQEAGFEMLSVHPIVHNLELENGQRYWERTLASSPVTKKLVEALSQEDQVLLENEVIRHLDELFHGIPISLPAKAYIVCGQKQML
eukprot:c4756_g1_i1.p1 GENE.c4756_g1_i1~~c4756_g1_i1.p1  ORF type:complete len:177 (+),score=28.45 c4756_g1_i1:336-866(+)